MNTVNKPSNYLEFGQAIRTEVNKYFITNNLRKTGNWKLYRKTIVLFAIFAVCYGLLVFANLHWSINLLLSVVLGFNLTAIGCNVMHDGSHGTYSNKKWLNKSMAFTMNIMGGSSYMWNQKHNIIHHNNNNIEEHDEDIDIKPFIRTNENQPRNWMHQYQHIYFIFLYGIAALWSNYVLDFVKYFTGKIANHQIKKMKAIDHIVFWGGKMIHVVIFLVIPMFFAGVLPTIIGYLIVFGLQGMLLAVVLHLAHIVEETSFYTSYNDEKKEDTSGLYHHLSTTANFGTQSKLLYWFIGGLNFHIEHHLFPNVSHIHYVEIHKIVKGLSKEYNVQYHEYPSLLEAFQSHVRHFKAVGRARKLHYYPAHLSAGKSLAHA